MIKLATSHLQEVGLAKQSALEDINDSVSLLPSIHGIMQLKENGRLTQAAEMAFQVRSVIKNKSIFKL